MARGLRRRPGSSGAPAGIAGRATLTRRPGTRLITAPDSRVRSQSIFVGRAPRSTMLGANRRRALRTNSHCWPWSLGFLGNRLSAPSCFGKAREGLAASRRRWVKRSISRMYARVTGAEPCRNQGAERSRPPSSARRPVKGSSPRLSRKARSHRPESLAACSVAARARAVCSRAAWLSPLRRLRWTPKASSSSPARGTDRSLPFSPGSSP